MPAYDALAPFDASAHEPIARIRYWNQSAVLVNDHALIHDLLVTQDGAFRKGPILSVNARPLLGNGLLTSLGQANRERRKMVGHAFAHKKVGDYAPLVLTHADREIDRWRDGQTVEMGQAFLNMTMGAMGEMLLSEDFSGSSKRIAQSLVVLMNYAVDGLRAPVRAYVKLPVVAPALLYLKQAVNARIRARRKARASGRETEGDLLDVLLGGDLSNRDITDEAMTLFLAGLETVAVALTWAVYLLATHGEIYQGVQAEVDTALNGQMPGAASLALLPLTLRVYKEALRLYPPVYIVARQSLKPVQLGDAAFTKGTTFFASPYVQHRTRPEFIDPLAFRPDRWENPSWEKSLPRYAYFPFGGGPHVCVGGHLAMLQGHLLLARVLQTARFALVPGQTIVPEPLFTLRPKNGVMMTVTRRVSSA